jgi:hypothetical protein
MTWAFAAIGALVSLAPFAMLLRYWQEPLKAGAERRKETGVA